MPYVRAHHDLLATISVVAVCAALGCAAKSAQVAATPDPGRTHFEAYCAACHLYDGQGMGDAPPLDGTVFVSGPQERLVKIVLHGIRGEIEVDGRTHDREMPGFGEILSDDDVAQLVSFVRATFGSADQATTTGAVAEIRAANAGRGDYWSVEELLAP